MNRSGFALVIILIIIVVLIMGLGIWCFYNRIAVDNHPLIYSDKDGRCDMTVNFPPGWGLAKARSGTVWPLPTFTYLSRVSQDQVDASRGIIVLNRGIVKSSSSESFFDQLKRITTRYQSLTIGGFSALETEVEGGKNIWIECPSNPEEHLSIELSYPSGESRSVFDEAFNFVIGHIEIRVMH